VYVTCTLSFSLQAVIDPGDRLNSNDVNRPYLELENLAKSKNSYIR